MKIIFYKLKDLNKNEIELLSRVAKENEQKNSNKSSLYSLTTVQRKSMRKSTIVIPVMQTIT